MKIKLQDGIIVATYPKGMHLDMETAKRLLAVRLEMQAGKAYPLLIHINGLISNSKDVRMFMAEEGIEGVSIGAFVVKKKHEEILVNLFLTIDSPKVPTRVFSEEKDAVLWIKQEMSKMPLN